MLISSLLLALLLVLLALLLVLLALLLVLLVRSSYSSSSLSAACCELPTRLVPGIEEGKRANIWVLWLEL